MGEIETGRIFRLRYRLDFHEIRKGGEEKKPQAASWFYESLASMMKTS